MDRETLRKVQLVQLEMAKEIKRVCDDLKIDYNLDSGSLLGAVRHKGFIPWDDDMDFGMTRKNYERFIAEAPSLLSTDYLLQTWHNDSEYGLPFAKLRKKGTVYIEESSENSGSENGFFIDIFPYNSYPSKSFNRFQQGLQYDLYRRLILIKCHYSPWKDSRTNSSLKKIVYSIGRLFVVGVSKERLIAKYEKACMKYENKQTEYVFPSGTSNYGKWIIKRKCLEELSPLLFEDEVFKCPKDYDSYLHSAYGDYMILPPEEQRENRHHITKISFGKE